MSEEKPVIWQRFDATDYLSTEESIQAFLAEAEAMAKEREEVRADILSAAQAVVRRSRERYGLAEPQPEQCQFCGMVMVDPCESLPPDICEKAIEAGGRADE
jgi:hypothetical protein